MGSPLGITEVQDFSKELPHCKTLAVPPTVKRWVNVCDPLDPVALGCAGQRCVVMQRLWQTPPASSCTPGAGMPNLVKMLVNV